MNDLLTLSAADLPVNAAELLISLGCPVTAHTDALRDMAHTAIARARALSAPRAIGRLFPLAWMDGHPTLVGAALPLPGEDIAEHLAGCDRCLLLAVTLGHTTEREIHRLAPTPSEALYFDTACSLLVEAAADAAQETLLSAIPHGRVPFRYSPGYGDLPLSIQPQFLATLDAPRRLGLTLTASGLMLPRKSITGIVGIET